jgi:pre-mRNA-splicing factor ATP-dependent RNA helicase DHX15/PRP43
MNISLDKFDKNWAYMNYLSGRALQQAENVRTQLERTMERYEIKLVSTADERKLFVGIRKALVCGFFMQVAHREGEKSGYITVKDNQVS